MDRYDDDADEQCYSAIEEKEMCKGTERIISYLFDYTEPPAKPAQESDQTIPLGPKLVQPYHFQKSTTAAPELCRCHLPTTALSDVDDQQNAGVHCQSHGV